MKAVAYLLFPLFAAVALGEPREFVPHDAVHGSIEPFLSFLRRSTDYVESGAIDIDRFSEDVTSKFSEIMTGRSTLQVGALEKVNEAMAITQLEDAIKLLEGKVIAATKVAAASSILKAMKAAWTSKFMQLWNPSPPSMTPIEIPSEVPPSTESTTPCPTPTTAPPDEVTENTPPATEAPPCTQSSTPCPSPTTEPPAEVTEPPPTTTPTTEVPPNTLSTTACPSPTTEPPAEVTEPPPTEPPATEAPPSTQSSTPCPSPITGPPAGETEAPPTAPPAEEVPPTAPPAEEVPPTAPPAEEVPPTAPPAEEVPPTEPATDTTTAATVAILKGFLAKKTIQLPFLPPFTLGI